MYKFYRDLTTPTMGSMIPSLSSLAIVNRDKNIIKIINCILSKRFDKFYIQLSHGFTVTPVNTQFCRLHCISLSSKIEIKLDFNLAFSFSGDN